MTFTEAAIDAIRVIPGPAWACLFAILGLLSGAIWFLDRAERKRERVAYSGPSVAVTVTGLRAEPTEDGPHEAA